MSEESKIASLIYLLDDTDEFVYQRISNEILRIGFGAIPHLEHALTNTSELFLQQRMEGLVRKIRLSVVKEELRLWKESSSFDLLKGVLAVNHYGYPNLQEEALINELEEIKRSVWQEMKPDMGPSKIVYLINSIFYRQYGFKPSKANYSLPDNAYLSQVIEQKTGNQLLLSIIYLLVAQRSNIPIYGVSLPRNFLLAYTEAFDSQKVEFYIDAFHRGALVTYGDIDQFLVDIDVEPWPEFYVPCSNETIVGQIVANLIDCYTVLKDSERVSELRELKQILAD